MLRRKMTILENGVLEKWQNQIIANDPYHFWVKAVELKSGLGVGE